MRDRVRGLIPEELSGPLGIAAAFYSLHLFLLPRTAGTEIALLCALVALMVALWRRDLNLRFHELYIPLTIYSLATLASAVTAPNPIDSLQQASDVGILLAFPVGLTLLRRSPRLVDSAFLTLAAMASIQALIGVVQFIQRGDSLERRITGSTSHVMSLAGILLPISLLALIWGLERRRWQGVVVGLLCLGALGLSLTRSAWIGWAAGCLFYLLARRPRWTSVLVPTAILVITLSPLALFGRFVSSFNASQSSNLDRIRMAQAGVEMIRDHPVLGLGPGNVMPMYPTYRLPDAPRFSVPHLHNNVIQIWAERGVVALFGYALILAFAFRICLAAVRQGGESSAWGYGVGAGTLALTTAGLFEYNFGDSEVLMCLLATVALVSAVVDRRVSESAAEAEAAA